MTRSMISKRPSSGTALRQAARICIARSSSPIVQDVFEDIGIGAPWDRVKEASRLKAAAVSHPTACQHRASLLDHVWQIEENAGESLMGLENVGQLLARAAANIGDATEPGKAVSGDDWRRAEVSSNRPRAHSG
jgi:hypothetical protein